ncbi:MAG: hypothetical protein WBQ79_21025 [Acidobacteriaceae bacterium]
MENRVEPAGGAYGPGSGLASELDSASGIFDNHMVEYRTSNDNCQPYGLAILDLDAAACENCALL